MTGPIWAVPGSSDDPTVAEANRLADRLEAEGATEERPRVVGIAFDGLVETDAPAIGRADEVVRLVREGGAFRSGSAGVDARADALRSLSRAAGNGDGDASGDGEQSDVSTGGRERPTAVLFPSTPDGDELAAVTARRLRGGCVTDCLLRVREGELRAGRTAYEGRAYAEISFERGPPVVSLNADVLESPPDSGPDEAPPERTHRVDLEGDEAIRRVDTLEVPERDLTRAPRIVAGGYGLGGPEGFDAIEKLADSLGASVGASRPPADEGWVPYDRQIGVTGKEIDVDLYVPCAISGDSYHMRSVNADHLVPINVDPDAPIFNVADLGIVGDVFEYGPVIAEAIRAASDDAGTDTDVAGPEEVTR
ncbi:Electron transfer flavoprotein alpha subunit (plasmid) [Haloterrigena turkmenica DSM 5511]|uniref:Electron transfer flavoprotein alpha subunit n=1 Tax=Haloterrigena turkmenica (strain ATCC 51198 / DSM 5511 / JCM 9101 / NCIMB 13204 / VKM B-1734 / 4k) TaxID=543526 RepID=D2S021_HALTV|nr:electron transfer flavoprotein subunit alpha/FixB family protein [Haloterrigena turkmenica]ADB62718.1 Electron transfer flavoprotein alpha subunit [Haloterrigena turkmenica DSM 5511]